MKKYARTISRRMGIWETIKCYNYLDGEMKLVKWGIKKWVAPSSSFVFFNTYNEVLDYIKTQKEA